MFQRMVINLAGHVGRLMRFTWAWTSRGQQEWQQQEKVEVQASKEPEKDFAYLSKVSGPVVISLQDNVDYTRTSAFRFVFMPDQEPRRHHQQKPQQQLHQQLKQSLEAVLQSRQQNQEEQHQQQQQQHQLQQQQQQQQQQQLDLLECISRKSGLPRWFIAVTIFTSALVILWLCFTLTAPPDDIKVVKTKPPDFSVDENDDGFDDFDDDLNISEKKKLLAHADDVIKIRIENV
ncbi:probable serine/threonine-protein kinase DDB_G0267686 [Penaeus japonicus]|uniref:probable serine/threonine-protein kinase DDB_G0267686 n=1 Tax=Penaeus japonicus TaxID=27405 RepID=UPI001C70CEDD|nr:probable serine/threonine-protein kinase DDB_G0267686 [Penaeus japonicus]